METYIGEPNVYTVSIHNLMEVDLIVKKILEADSVSTDKPSPKYTEFVFMTLRMRSFENIVRKGDRADNQLVSLLTTFWENACYQYLLLFPQYTIHSFQDKSRYSNV